VEQESDDTDQFDDSPKAKSFEVKRNLSQMLDSVDAGNLLRDQIEEHKLTSAQKATNFLGTKSFALRHVCKAITFTFRYFL
jgi:hypothetical protein